MASSDTDSPGTIYRWIERKPLTEAVTWTSREKFWLITAACHYGTHDWKSVAQVVRNAGEPYRPREWYTPKSCERQFRILVSNLSKEVKSLPLIDMLQHIAEGLKNDYIRDANKSKDTLKSKYCNLFSVLNRVKQGNLSRNEVVSLYSQARRNEIEGKQYMEQLMTRQNASLASENSSSGLIEEQPIKWNTPSAPLLTSLLRSRNTIPVNRTATTIASLLQSPGGTSRTRSGKLLPLTPSIRTTQGTPTLSKLLEAPANPYIPSPPLSTQKNKLSEIGTERLANISRKENSQSTPLNKVRVDNMTTLGSLNQVSKSDLSASKKQTSKSLVSAVKNGSKANSIIVNLSSDGETEEETKNTSLKSSFGDKKNTSSRLEPRTTRSQTRAEGSFKQLSDTKLSDGKKERESLQQQSGGSKINETHIIEDDVIDIDQIEVEPLSSIQDEIQSQTPSKMTRSSLQRLRLLSPGDNLLTNTKVNSKEISNKMLEETSANSVSNSTSTIVIPEYKCLLGQPGKSDKSESLIPINRSACKDAIMIRKESQLSQNKLTTFNSKLLKQEGIIEIKAANIRCIDSRNDSKCLSYNKQPIVVVNKIKKPLNIQLASDQRKTDDIQVSGTDVIKPTRLNNSSQNVVKLIDSNCTLDDDEVIIIEDDININEGNITTMKTKELSSITESKTLPSTVLNNSKSTEIKFDDKKNKNDKSPWNIFGKTHTTLDTTKKLQDSVSKSRTNSNINESNNKELDFDFDQSISQTSLSELYNGVDMHSFDNEDLTSLIECGSLNSNDTEEHINTVGADQGDSSVSESDSTIGAFDTFAQITRVRQKSFTSKDIKLDTKDSKTTKQEVKHLKESFCQSEVVYDDQISTASSVPGIPILKGVISDVMSQIDFDSVASHKVPMTDVVEISSDEEVMADVPKAIPLYVNQIQTQGKEVNSNKLKDNDFIKIHEIEGEMYKGVTVKRGTNTIKPLDIGIPQFTIVKNLTSDAAKMACNKILEFKGDITQKYKNQDIELTFVSNTGNIREVNESYEAKIIQPEEITVKIAKAKLKKESEERRKKEVERKKQEDNERKKKEDNEKKKKEEDRMKRELEKKQQQELYIKMKNEEEERKNKEDNERKKKEEDERKKDLQEKMKIEEQKECETYQKYKEVNDKTIASKLPGFHNSGRKKCVANESIETPMNADVTKQMTTDYFCDYFTSSNESGMMQGRSIKEEIMDDEAYNRQIVHEQIVHEQIVHEQIVHEQIVHEQIVHEQIVHEQIVHGQIVHGQIIKEEIIEEEEMTNEEMMNCELINEEIVNNEIANEEITNEKIINEKLVNEEITNEETINEEVIDGDSCINNEYDNEMFGYKYLSRLDGVIDDDESLSHTECTEVLNIETQSDEEPFKSQNKNKKGKKNNLRNNRETKITARDVQVQRRCTEFQSQIFEHQFNVAERAEKQSSVKAKIQKSDENKELISRTVKEFKISMAKGLELLRLDLPEDSEKVKLNDAELINTFEKLSSKALNKTCLKTFMEPENNQPVEHTDVNLVKNYGVSPMHSKKKNSKVETVTNIEQGMIENRKAATKTDIEALNVRQQGVKKLVRSEGKSSKGLETMSTEIKMITRTRGLKSEEKLKKSNVSKNVSTKRRSQIKSHGSSSSSASPTIEENPAISSYEYKRQSKKTDDTSKRNSSSNTYNNKNNRALNIDSSGIVRKENLNLEVTSIPRTRTRSSSFKQRIISETRSSKQDQDNGAAVIPKETVGTKAIVSISTHPDHRTTRSKSPPKTILNKHTFNDNNCGKTLIIPVVMLTTAEIPLHKIHQRSVTNFIKQQENKPTHDQIQKQVLTTTKIDKLPPKKRGRKRRIDVQNEKHQDANSINKTTSQKVAKINALIEEVEPPAKRTRRSLELRGCENNSMKKQLHNAQPRSTTVQPCEYKEKCVNKDSIQNIPHDEVLKRTYNHICKNYKFFVSHNKEVMSLPSENRMKCEIQLQDIERYIASGELKTINDLLVNFLILSYNIALMYDSNSEIQKKISEFQDNLTSIYQKYIAEFGEEYISQNVPKLCTPKKISSYIPFSIQSTEEHLEFINDMFYFDEAVRNGAMNNYFDMTNDESADSDDINIPPPIKRRKKNISDTSNSESD